MTSYAHDHLAGWRYPLNCAATQRHARNADGKPIAGWLGEEGGARRIAYGPSNPSQRGAEL